MIPLEIQQAGVIPYRRVDGEIQILAITSRHFGHWQVPKGMVEPEMTDAQSACAEAYEEAGITGRIGKTPIGHYVYEKDGRHHRVRLFLFEVEQVLDDWPEEGQRKRAWFSLEEAASLVEPEGLKKVIRGIADVNV